MIAIVSDIEIKALNNWLENTVIKRSRIHNNIIMGYKDGSCGCCLITKTTDRGWLLKHYPDKTAKAVADSATLPFTNNDFSVKDTVVIASLCILLRHFDKEGLDNEDLDYPIDWRG